MKDLAKQTNEATGEIRGALSGILVAAEHATGHGVELAASIEAVRTLTHGMVEQLQEQSQVAVAAAKYVDQAAAEVDAIGHELNHAAVAVDARTPQSPEVPVPTTEEGAASCH